MKNTVVKMAALGLALFSVNAFAEKIIITGQPYMLQKQGDFYVVPDTAYKATLPYQYVTVEGKQRACFLDRRPDFVNLDVVSINVQVGGQPATWNCYATDPTYFVVQP